MIILLCNKHFCVSSLQNWHSFFLLPFSFLFYSKEIIIVSFPFEQMQYYKGGQRIAVHIYRMKKKLWYSRFSDPKKIQPSELLIVHVLCFYLQSGKHSV
jgi:hypothetical protein